MKISTSDLCLAPTMSVLQRMDFAEKLAHIGYWELDIKAKRFYWSSQMYEIFGVRPDAINGKKNLFREQILAEDLPIYKEKLSDLLRYHKEVEGEIRIRHTDGHIVYCNFTAAIKGGRIAGVLQDVSHWVAQRQELEEAQKHAEAANRDKSYFLAQASHDLRQPLQAIQLFTDALEHSEPTEKQKDLIKKIDASVDNFRLLLDNLLDISKLDFEKVEFEPQKFNLAVLLQHLCEEYHIAAQRNGICVFCRYPSIVIENDYILLERILRNLLSNAIKYAKGKVMLSCKQTDTEVIIRVIDNGIGIKAEEEQYIYDEFYQSHDIPDNKKLGAGLGLSIVKRLSKIIKARIVMRSHPNKYTVFTLYLPRKI